MFQSLIGIGKSCNVSVYGQKEFLLIVSIPNRDWEKLQHLEFQPNFFQFLEGFNP